METGTERKMRADSPASGPTQKILCAEEAREIGRQLCGVSGHDRLFVVAWAPRGPAETSLADLLAVLPRQTGVVLTGSNSTLLAWTTLTTGDLRALAAQFGHRWIVIQPDPRQAIVGVMQQLGDDDSLFIIRPETASAREIKYWTKAGDEYRGQSHPWDE